MAIVLEFKRVKGLKLCIGAIDGVWQGYLMEQHSTLCSCGDKLKGRSDLPVR